jgi:hypothetical protein
MLYLSLLVPYMAGQPRFRVFIDIWGSRQFRKALADEFGKSKSVEVVDTKSTAQYLLLGGSIPTCPRSDPMPTGLNFKFAGVPSDSIDPLRLADAGGRVIYVYKGCMDSYSDRTYRNIAIHIVKNCKRKLKWK